MIDLIALVVTLIIMSLFGLGLLMMVIIMSQERPTYEQIYNDEEEIKFIKEYQEKKKIKQEARRRFVNNLISKIKKIITGR